MPAAFGVAAGIPPGRAETLGAPLFAEDFRPVLAGTAQYLADLEIDGCLEVGFVRSPVAHAVVSEVGLARVRRQHGVVGAFSALDLPFLPLVPPSPGNERHVDGYPRSALATDRVRYVGEPLAVMAATSSVALADAVDEAVLDFEDLGVASDLTGEGRGPQLFPPQSNLVFDVTLGAKSVGDLLDACEFVVERRQSVPRLAHLSLEGRAIVVDPRQDPIAVWCSTQAPSRLHDALVGAFPDLADEDIRVRVLRVGGAFGLKSHIFPEYLAAFELARQLKRPVRWVETRREGLSAGAHGRGQLQQIVIGADGDGRIVAASIDIMGDLGAYPHYGAYVPLFTGTVLSGPYAIEHVSTRIRGILTNRAPTCPYRGAGRPEAAFLLERTMDDLAAEMGTDPADLRRRNFIAPDAFPYHSPTGAVYDSGNYERMLADALETVGYADLRQQQAASPVIAGRALGVGLGAFVERSGGAVGSSEVGAIEVTADGEVICLSGSMSSGQEHITSFSQVVADVLEVPLGQISVIEGDTGRIRLGTGTFASRSMQVGGSALHQAAKTIRQQALERVAAMLEIQVEDLKYAGGFVEVADASVEPMSLASVVAQTGPLQTESTFVSDQAFPSGVYAAVVEVDIETGEIFVDRIVTVDDCGIVVNPRIVYGQVVGSTVQGVGQALFEEILYDEHGQLMSGSLASYLLPTALTTPDVISLLAPTMSPVSPLGSKGAGEGGCIGAPAALLNAIQDALRRAGSGADISLPATPYKTWEALRR